MSKDVGAIPYCNGLYVSNQTYLGQKVCNFCNFCNYQKDYSIAYGTKIKTCKLHS